MKKFLVLFAVIASLITNICLAYAAPEAKKDQNGKNKSFIWEVTSPNDKGKIYITGAVHAGLKENFPLNESIEKMYKESDEIIAELDIIKVEEDNLAKDGILSYGDKVSEVLKTLYSLYGTVFNVNIENNLKAIDNFNTEYKNIIESSSNREIQKLVYGKYDPEYGIDRYFIKKAKSDNKKINELEAYDFQEKLINKINLKIGVKAIKNMFNKKQKNSDIVGINSEEMIGSLYQYINEGDLEGLSNYYLEYLKSTGYTDKMIDELLYNRNEDWVGKIDNYIKNDKKYFMVVGAGHLGNEKGVIKLLENKGYSAKQLD